VSNHDVIIEIKSPRIPRFDPGGLEAGFRKHQSLGIGIHPKRLKKTWQISIRAGSQVDFPADQIPAKARNPVIQGTCIVLNRRVIDRNQGGFAKPLASGPAGHSASQNQPSSKQHATHLRHLTRQLANPFPFFGECAEDASHKGGFAHGFGEIPQSSR
jgi:hypothetical protein